MKAFETKTDLLPHQQEAVQKMLPTRVGGLFMEMGTGKSRAAIELAKLRADKIDRVIWFCPVALKETVEAEILKHTDCADIYMFDDKTRDGHYPDVRWYIVGIESMSSSNRVVATVNKIITKQSMVICDESSYIKGHRAKRTQRITHISARARYRITLTGTPISQGVVDLFAQMRFLSPKILGYRSFYSFAANHLEYSDKYPGMIVRSHNLGYLASKIQPYVYQVTKDECLSLPEKLYTSRYFSMSDEQVDWYNRVKDEILDELDRYEYEDHFFTSLAIFKMFSALQQVTCGFVTWGGQRHTFYTPRLDLLVNSLKEYPQDEKVLIFGKYQHDIDAIRMRLGDEFGEDSVAYFDGRVSAQGRGEAVKRFKASARYLVVTQSTGGHGFNFQDVCHNVIFYNNGFKYSERLQAEDRIHRIGQDRKVLYTDIYCVCGIESRIERAIQRKADTVAQFKQEVDKLGDDVVNLSALIKDL